MLRSVPEEAPWQVADADRDIGHGTAEPALCQHGGSERSAVEEEPHCADQCHHREDGPERALG